MVWNCVHGVTPAYLSDFCVLRSSASAICSDWHSTGSTCLDCNWTTKIHSRDMEPCAASTTDTEPIGERLQAGTEDAPVLDCPAPLRRLHDSDAGYKYSDLLTYFLSSQSRLAETQHPFQRDISRTVRRLLAKNLTGTYCDRCPLCTQQSRCKRSKVRWRQRWI